VCRGSNVAVVDLEHLFNGSALNAVDAKGRLSIPAFIRTIVERRSEAKAVIIGMHDADPCLAAYDRGYGRYLQQEIERRRLAEEAAGGQFNAHAARRRAFGIVEDVPYDPSGRIILPQMLRKKGQIEDLALFVGAGGTFEIWNPYLALKSEDPDLRDLAAWRLEEKGLPL
jgi:MraZ protein